VIALLVWIKRRVRATKLGEGIGGIIAYDLISFDLASIEARP